MAGVGAGVAAVVVVVVDFVAEVIITITSPNAKVESQALIYTKMKSRFQYIRAEAGVDLSTVFIGAWIEFVCVSH